jgi:hypothetical protein
MFFGLIINEVILQTASSLPSIAVIGLILGVLTGNKPIINGAIAFVVFILRFIYLESYKYEFFEHSIPFYAPMWSFMIDVLIWFGFFVIFTVIGHKFKKLLQRMHSQPFASRERKNRAT